MNDDILVMMGVLANFAQFDSYSKEKKDLDNHYLHDKNTKQHAIIIKQNIQIIEQNKIIIEQNEEILKRLKRGD